MTGVQTSPWLRRFHPKAGATGRLVFLPHAGGSASYYHPFSTLLADRPIDVLVAQYPGRQDRTGEPLVGDITVLADHITGALRGWTDLPLVLFGHSMGATVAFEVGRRLEKSGTRPVSLFASARRAPSISAPERTEGYTDRELVTEVMSMDAAASELLADETFLELVMPAIRNDYAAVAHYRYVAGPDVSCPIVALVGDTDSHVTRDQAQAWAGHTSGPFELRSFHGGHFYLDNHRDAIVSMLLDRF